MEQLTRHEIERKSNVFATFSDGLVFCVDVNVFMLFRTSFRSQGIIVYLHTVTFPMGSMEKMIMSC